MQTPLLPLSAAAQLPLGERPKGKTLLTAEWLLGWRNGAHCLLHKGEIVFEHNQILYIGPAFAGDVARRIDFGKALISPGLIDLDALSDLDTYLLVQDNQPGWAKGRVWPRSYLERGPYEMYSDEELAFQKRFSFGLLLLNGITSAAPVASLYSQMGGNGHRIRGGSSGCRRTGIAGVPQSCLSLRRHGSGSAWADRAGL